MSKVRAITVNGVEIKISSVDNNDYLCISDFVKNISEHPEDVIQTWIRSKTTIRYFDMENMAEELGFIESSIKSLGLF